SRAPVVVLSSLLTHGLRSRWRAPTRPSRQPTGGAKAEFTAAGGSNAVATPAPRRRRDRPKRLGARQFLDADEVAGGVAHGAVADAVGLVRRLLNDVRAARRQALERGVQVAG